MVQLDTVHYAAIEKGMTEADIRALGPHIAPSFQYLYKPMEANGAKIAVLLINNGDTDADLTLNFTDVPEIACSTCSVRDIWNHKDLGTMKTSYTAKAVASHDCAFLIITPAAEEEMLVFT